MKDDTILRLKIELLELKINLYELNENKEKNKNKFFNENKKYYSVSEASKILKVSPRTVQRGCKREKIKKINDKYIIPYEVVLDWEESEGLMYKFDNDLQTKTYLMKDTNTGLYKIGKSKNPKHREKTLQSEKPTIKLVKIWEKDIENELHNLYHKFRVRGEWFKLTSVQIKYICTRF